MKIDYVYLATFYLLRFLVFVLPNFALNVLANVVAKIVFKLNRKHRKIIDTNLSLCFPELSQAQRAELALKIYINFAHFGIDFFRNQNINPKNLEKKVSFENEEEFSQFVQDNRAIVFVTAHFGNWELLPLAFANKYKAISIVGRRLDSELMDKFLVKNRTQFDVELIDKKGGLRKMLLALRNKRALGILTDQDASDNESMVLEFFGKKVNWLLGASVIAKKSEALLIPAFIYKTSSNSYAIRAFKAMDAKEHSSEELTHYQAKCCEEMIRFKPDEYFFFHKRFKRFYSVAYES
ncbi:lipid A biosynthesis lauroyl acyltransferase [Campylobacter sp. MIT 97-5078]|uniref:lipid A biosynthesis lauroyl acyltransferase n=1 Tax=Campylobacter sp. MIT 97-5078 TaxID=1548153 RepID=UPI000513CE52|nr:lipid A biosynthesis lauroyl acyltransferase [Campylobacter sp. MIT 97-5078]KGI55919.1 lauroyl acyltransferase [Campylobacter sp. MIT 97-5078]TQR27638.1 lauroyl acyltransferase [Campylobacter sp. MIT 97-5078]